MAPVGWAVVGIRARAKQWFVPAVRERDHDSLTLNLCLCDPGDNFLQAAQILPLVLGAVLFRWEMGPAAEVDQNDVRTSIRDLPKDTPGAVRRTRRRRDLWSPEAAFPPTVERHQAR